MSFENDARVHAWHKETLLREKIASIKTCIHTLSMELLEDIQTPTPALRVGLVHSIQKLKELLTQIEERHGL